MEYTIKPSVTDVVRILDKPALLGWANKIGLQGVSLAEHKKKFCGEGHSLHKQMENYLREKTPFSDPEFQARFVEFFADKSIVAFEKQISHAHFTGRLDVEFYWKDKLWVCDFKLNQTGVYLENKLQLAAYRMAEGADAVAIINYPKMEIVDVGISNFEPYERLFNLLCQACPLVRSL